MISDVLFDAVQDIKEYLTHEGTKDCYVGEIGEVIQTLIKHMELVQLSLDLPPDLAKEFKIEADINKVTIK